MRTYINWNLNSLVPGRTDPNGRTSASSMVSCKRLSMSLHADSKIERMFAQQFRCEYPRPVAASFVARYNTHSARQGNVGVCVSNPQVGAGSVKNVIKGHAAHANVYQCIHVNTTCLEPNMAGRADARNCVPTPTLDWLQHGVHNRKRKNLGVETQ
eukprot:1125733-Amphidinium_carterae.1